MPYLGYAIPAGEHDNMLKYFKLHFKKKTDRFKKILKRVRFKRKLILRMRKQVKLHHLFLKKTGALILFVAFLLVSLFVGQKYGGIFFSNKIKFFNYRLNNTIIAKNTSEEGVINAVPVLMYHGVKKEVDAENTTIENFITQMEMLKNEGYRTITLPELDDFLNGKIKLNGKAIVITFDDGRKDSYYSTDKILKALNYSAVIFISTNKPEVNDPFYLSWDELKTMQKSGRWEVQAHGKNAHTKITINSNGEEGSYLSSRLYTDNGLESIADFEKRVENDYLNSINDIKNNLGYTPEYYSIPLNDYGFYPLSNYDQAIPYNNKLIKKYFRLAFSQANDSKDVTKFHEDAYNYPNEGTFVVNRIQVKNMTAQRLKEILEAHKPTIPDVAGTENMNDLKNILGAKYGEVDIINNSLHLIDNKEFPSARVIIGSEHWKDYSVSFTMSLLSGRSVALIAYLQDNDNYLSFGITDSSLFLRQKFEGREKDLFTTLYNKSLKNKANVYRLKIVGDKVDAYLNGKLVYKNVSINVKRGAVAFRVWDDKGNGEGVLEFVHISPQI
jgi:peptidoglycan/xylan/chitin deacetylase (PgdA/CDA1 family)